MIDWRDMGELITDHEYVPRADRSWKFCDICSKNRILHKEKNYKVGQYYQYLRGHWGYSDSEAVIKVQELERYFSPSTGDIRENGREKELATL